MKKLIVAAALGLVAVGALAQGQFSFGNKNLAAGIDAKATLQGGGSPEGTAYWAQAYVKLAADPDTSFAPVGAAVNFRTGANAGYIVPTILTTTYAGGTAVAVEMRAWQASAGTSYESALLAGGFVGKSAPVNLTVTVAPATPPDMVGIASFQLAPIPEPSTLALGALGVAAFLLRRRS
jgi:hypothetical protein